MEDVDAAFASLAEALAIAEQHANRPATGGGTAAPRQPTP
jgi:hypothetical protein